MSLLTVCAAFSFISVYLFYENVRITYLKHVLDNKDLFIYSIQENIISVI